MTDKEKLIIDDCYPTREKYSIFHLMNRIKQFRNERDFRNALNFSELNSEELKDVIEILLSMVTFND